VLAIDLAVNGELNIPSGWECKPENKNKLEGVVEWEPVYGAHCTLEDSQEGEDDPVLDEGISSSVRGRILIDIL
jgi:hypothetical protein